MRNSKKRKLAGVRTKPLHVVLREEVYEDLGKLAGSLSLGETVEKLVQREVSRRTRKLESLQVVRNN